MHKLPKTILITGCSGFLGSQLTNKLIQKNYIVIGLDKKKIKIKHKNFYFKKIDITSESQVKKY